MLVTHIDPAHENAESDVATFFNNLKESALQEIQAGRPVVFTQELDVDTLEFGEQTFQGGTTSVHLGRPAYAALIPA